MDNKRVVVYIVILSLAVLLLYNQFHITGFVTEGQRVIVSLDIPPDQQKIKPGQSLLIETAIRVPGGNIDQTTLVELEYSIKDLEGNIISLKRESGAIAVKESAVTSLLIPTDTEPGVYTAVVSVDYEGEVYEGSKTFEIIGQDKKLSFFYVLIIIMIIIIVILLFLLWRRNSKDMEGRKERLRFGGLSKMFGRSFGGSIFHRNSTKQSNVRKNAKAEKKEVLDKLALISKKEKMEPSYKSNIKYQNEKKIEGQQQSEAELIEEVVEETEEKNKERETVEEMIEEADESNGKDKSRRRLTRRKRR